MQNNKGGWAFKYAPKSIDEMILNRPLKDRFKEMVKTKSVINCTLHGVQGIGKTTLARLIVDELGDNCAVCFIECGVDNSIDMVRGKLTDFVESYQPDKIKIAILDEADSLSGTSTGTEGNSAQKALRSVMNTDDVTFILTCNNLGSLSPAIQSRCTPVKLAFESSDVLRRCVQILNEEGIKADKETVQKFYANVLIPSLPDIRSVVRQLEFWSDGGIFHEVQGTTSQKETDVMASYIMEELKKGTKCRDISVYYIGHCDEFNSDYVQLAMSLFRMLYNHPKIQIMISDSIYKMNFVVDKEIMFYATLLQIDEMLKQSSMNG